MQKFYNGKMRDMTLLTEGNLDSFRGDINRHYIVNTNGEFAPNNYIFWNEEANGFEVVSKKHLLLLHLYQLV